LPLSYHALLGDLRATLYKAYRCCIRAAGSLSQYELRGAPSSRGFSLAGHYHLRDLGKRFAVLSGIPNFYGARELIRRALL
jgi:hypothetical protein